MSKVNQLQVYTKLKLMICDIFVGICFLPLKSESKYITAINRKSDVYCK